MRRWRCGGVPQAWRGLWRRLSLERADGSGDITTLVLWLQAEALYVDLRIPADRPRAGRFVPALARQEGFAGQLLHDGDHACWERRIDFHPLGKPDEGRLVRERRMMVEHGLHEAYVEHWWHEGTDGETAAVADTDDLIAVRAGSQLMFARERRPVAPANLLQDVATAGNLAPLLDCEVAYARRGADGWRVLASTLPWREGALLTARELQEIGTS